MSSPEAIRTVHVYSMHTDPFAQPGSGDAGGMNVYIAQSVRAMLALNPQLNVEVFTLNRTPQAPERAHVEDPEWGSRLVRHYIDVPAAREATKNDLAEYLEDFAQSCVTQAMNVPDVIHAHYWLSGWAAVQAEGAWGRRIFPERVPGGADDSGSSDGSGEHHLSTRAVAIFFTPHTTAAAKDARRGPGEPAEPRIRHSIENRLPAFVDGYIVNTPLEAEELMQSHPSLSGRISIITPGVDTDIFRPLPGIHPDHDTSETRCRIVFAGRPQPLKGPHLLVEAFALLPRDLQVELDIIGRSESDYEQRLLDRAAELGLADRVRLKDPVPPEELARIFRSADIVACPSSSETFGLVALEAQACGAAVLASDVDGLRFAVENHRTGLLVAPRTAERWAAAIERLVRAPYLRHSLGANAAARARSMSWESTARKTLDVYETAVPVPRSAET